MIGSNTIFGPPAFVQAAVHLQEVAVRLRVSRFSSPATPVHPKQHHLRELSNFMRTVMNVV